MRYVFLVLALAGCGYWWWSSDPFRFAPVTYVSQEPAQGETNTPSFPFQSYGLFPRTFLIEPRATYDLTGRVLHKQFYFTRGFFGDLIPYDIAIGWKGMSDLNIIRPYMTFTHKGAHAMGRWYEYRYQWSAENAPSGEAMVAMADPSIKSNNHTIPANAKVFATLSAMGTGDIVHIKGYLVDVEWPGHPGWIWKTSLSRTHTNFTQWNNDNPDCETIFVTEASIR